MSNLLKAVEATKKTEEDEEVSDPTMKMVLSIVLTVQDKIKQSCNNEPFEDWSYEKVKALFFDRDS